VRAPPINLVFLVELIFLSQKLGVEREREVVLQLLEHISCRYTPGFLGLLFQQGNPGRIQFQSFIGASMRDSFTAAIE